MNAKIVESQSLRRGFRQSFHILDYFFIPVGTMHNKPIMTNEKGTEHQLLTESVIFYRKCFSYSSHIMIIQKLHPTRQISGMHLLLTYSLSTLSYYTRRKKRSARRISETDKREESTHPS